MLCCPHPTKIKKLGRSVGIFFFFFFLRTVRELSPGGAGADLAFFQGGGLTHRPRASRFFFFFYEPRSGEPIFGVLFYEPRSGEPIFFAILRAAKRRADFFLLFYEPRSGEPIFFAILRAAKRRADFFWLF